MATTGIPTREGAAPRKDFKVQGGVKRGEGLCLKTLWQLERKRNDLNDKEEKALRAPVWSAVTCHRFSLHRLVDASLLKSSDKSLHFYTSFRLKLDNGFVSCL